MLEERSLMKRPHIQAHGQARGQFSGSFSAVTQNCTPFLLLEAKSGAPHSQATSPNDFRHTWNALTFLWISAKKFLEINVLKPKQNHPHIRQKAQSSTTFQNNAFLKGNFSIKLRSAFVSFGFSSTSNKIKLSSSYILNCNCQQKK